MTTRSLRAARPRRLLTSLGAGYVNLVVATTCSLATVPLMMRYLGRQDYGLWLVVVSLFGPLGISGLGLPTVAQNRLAEAWGRDDWQSFNKTLSTAFCLIGGCSVLGGLGLLALAKFGVLARLLHAGPGTERRTLLVLLVAASGYLIAQPLQIFRLAFRALQRVDIEQTMQSVTAAATLGLIAAALFLGGGLFSVAVVSASMQVLSALLCLVYVVRRFPVVRTSLRLISFSLAGSMIPPGFHFVILALSGAMIWGMDNLVISAVLGTSFVVAYAIGFRLVWGLKEFLDVIGETTVPTISALMATRKLSELQALLLLVNRVGMAAGWLLAVQLAYYGRSFVGLWAGKQAVLDPASFLVLVGLLFASTIYQPYYFLLVATSRHRIYSYLAVGEGLFNLVLSWSLAHHFGVLGVALGTLVPNLLVSAIYLPVAGIHIVDLSFSKLLREGFLPPVPAAITAALTAYCLPLPASWVVFVGNVGLTSVVFLFVYWITALGPGEQAFLRVSFRSRGPKVVTA